MIFDRNQGQVISMHNTAQLKSAAALAVIAMTASACSMLPKQEPLRDPEFAPVRPMIQAPSREITGSIYNSGTSRFLFEDLKARRVGDIITVILEEKTDANKNASTSTKKNSGIDMPAPTLFGGGITHKGRPLLSNSMSAGSAFSGEGGSSQSNSLKGNLTVTVVEVLSNGYLIVRGEKLLSLNQGSEVVRISGIIRPVDIAPDNTVKSNQIANAEIAYKGKGLLANSNNAGWLTRFFNTGFWPF